MPFKHVLSKDNRGLTPKVIAESTPMRMLLPALAVLCAAISASFAADGQSNRGLMSRILSLRVDGAVTSVCFSPDKKMVAAGSDGFVLIWNDKGEAIQTLKAAPVPKKDEDPLIEAPAVQQWIVGLSFSPDNKSIAAACGDVVMVWNVATGAVVDLKGHTDNVTALDFSPDGTRLVTGGIDKTAIIWDTASGKPLHYLRDFLNPIVSVKFTRDGKQVVALATYRKGNESGELKKWDTSTGTLLETYLLSNCSPPSANLSPTGRVVMCTEVDTVNLWDSNTGEFVRKVGDAALCNRLTISSDLHYMAGSRNRSPYAPAAFKIWELKSGQFLDDGFTMAEKVLALGLTSDGSALAVGADGTVEIWVMNQ